MTQTSLSAARSTRRGEKLPAPAATHSSAIHNRDVKSLPLALPHPRNSLPFINNRRASALPFAQLYPRNSSALSVKHCKLISIPLALNHPRQPLASSMKNGSGRSPAPLAQPYPRNRFESFIQFSPATDRESRATEFLIANLELKFHSTHRKISPLKISNRKFSALSYRAEQRARLELPDFRLKFLATSHSPLATAFLIQGSAIKTCANPTLFQSHANF